MRQIRLIACCLTLWLMPGVSPAEPVDQPDGLQTALKLTATRNPAVMSKREELKALGFDLESAETQRYPTVSVQATTSSNIGSTTDTSVDRYGLAATLQQPLWTGGRINSAIRQADVKLRVGKLSLLSVQRQLMENAAALYATVLGARKRLEAAELNVSEHERLRALITRREAGGIASSADVNLANSRLSQARAQRIQLEGVLKRSLNDLFSLTQQQLPAQEPVPDGSFTLPPVQQVVGEMELSSPTVQLRQLDIELARAGADLAFANLMPTLHARLEQDIYTATQHGDTSPGTRIGVVLQGNVEGLGLSGWNRVKSSDARIDVARREVDAARNDVRQQAQDLLTEMENLGMVMESNELLVKSTAETLASFMRQYDAGRKSWVDVLNTQRELSDARLTLEQTRSSLLESRLRLAVQLGRFDVVAGVLP